MSDEAVALEHLARLAVDGDGDAVHRLVTALRADINGLALRMLWHREDAEDATQEILVRVVTRLSQFDHKSRLTTWVYRLAVNYLLDVKKSPIEQRRLTFAAFAEDLHTGLSTIGPKDAERSLLTEEVKLGCTLAMLQCLDRPHRLAYVLGEVFELGAPEASEALMIEPPTFRKRLQRARDEVRAFTAQYCGLVSVKATCQCNRRVEAARKLGRVHADDLQFAETPSSFAEARALIQRVEIARRGLELHRQSRPKDAPVELARRIISATKT